MALCLRRRVFTSSVDSTRNFSVPLGPDLHSSRGEGAWPLPLSEQNHREHDWAPTAHGCRDGGSPGLPQPLPLPCFEDWAVLTQEGKVGASAMGRDMLWMAHCRMPSKECCRKEQNGALGSGQSLWGQVCPPRPQLASWVGKWLELWTPVKRR